MSTKRKLVLVLNTNGTVNTGMKDGNDPFFFPCVDDSAEAMAEKVLKPIAVAKVSTWCG